MKRKRIWSLLGYFVMLSCLTVLVNACSKDATSDESMKTGIVKGVVTDEQNNPLNGVTVGLYNAETKTATNEKGEFSLADVPIDSRIISFSKDDYQTTSLTVTAAKFNTDGIANVTAVMTYAAAKIRGKVFDARNNNQPFAGVTVSISQNIKTTTGNDGAYELKNLPLADYNVTFEKEGYPAIVRKVTAETFVDNVTNIDVKMGSQEILRDLTLDDLKHADKWYYNEYRGGRNAESYPHWDWACNYMCTLDFRGVWDEQNEGTTLQIRNNAEQQKTNPADLEMFDSFVYGSKKITADNKIMTLQIRTHNATAEAPVYYGVQVVDLSQANPQAQLIGGVRTINSEAYQSVPVDLGAYVGKEVIVAVGIFRQQAGDYWKQLVLRRIAFAKETVSGWGWLPGQEVPGLEDWKMTLEMVRSTMAQTKTSFTGLSPINGNRDNYKDAYRAWREVGHIAAEWSYMPLRKDPEVFPSEGYLIKTRGGNNVSTTVPESYYYAKISIASGRNKMTFKTRNFSNNPTFFKITVIQENGIVTHVQPVSNTASKASKAADGCWQFVHQDGSTDRPNAYADFVYDLSRFNNQEVIIAIGVYKGEANNDENKLVLRSVTFN